MKKRNRKRASAGFSLLEVVAAITVLGIVVAAVSTSLVASIQFNARTEQRLQAELAVFNAAERLRAVGYNESYNYAEDDRYAGVSLDPVPDTVTYTQNGEDITKTLGYFMTITSTDDEAISVDAYFGVEAAP